MLKNKHIKIYYWLFFGITTFIFLSVLAGSKPSAQEQQSYSQEELQMNYPQEFEPYPHTSNTFPSSENQIIHLQAKEFNFASSIEFPASVLTNSELYAESINHENNGAFDLTMIKLDHHIKYLFQISTIAQSPCTDEENRACEQGIADVISKGNVAEIQLTLPDHQLIPKTYPLGEGGTTPLDEIILYSRQLYSDPAHGKLGCQTWGKGELKVKKAVYEANGTLKYLEADFFRVCEQTAPFPPILPEDNLLPIEVENIEKYIYHASWRLQL
jgi:hypothetical protein